MSNLMNFLPVEKPGPFRNSDEAYRALSKEAKIYLVGYTEDKYDLLIHPRDRADAEIAAKRLGIRLHQPYGYKRPYIDVKQHYALFNDPVEAALAKSDLRFLVGRIESLDEMFSSVYYTKRALGQDSPPGPGSKRFSLMLKGLPGVWYDARRKLELTVEMSDGMQKLVRERLGEISSQSTDTLALHPVSAFTLIAWPQQDVALLKINRPDGSDYMSYVGLIALSKIPQFEPNVPSEMAAPRRPRP